MPCLWLDNANGNERRVEINGDTLRDDALWRDYSHPRRRDTIARGIPNDETISRFEALVGHAIADNDIYWGKFHGAPVEIERLADDRLHIDADLALAIPLHFDDGLDLDVDMVLSCEDGQITIGYENLESDRERRWYRAIPLFNSYLFLSWPELEFAPNNTQSYRNGCPAISIETNGDITFTEPVERIVADPNIDMTVDDCAFSDALDAFVVTVRGPQSEQGAHAQGTVSVVYLDGTIRTEALGFTGASTPQYPGAVRVVDDVLYLSDRLQTQGSEKASAVISKWDVKSGEYIGLIRLPGVAGIRDFAVTQSGDIFVVESAADGRVLKVSGTRVVEFPVNAKRYVGTVSSVSLDVTGHITLTGQNSDLAVVFDRTGKLVERQIMASDGVARAVQLLDGSKVTSDGARGTLTHIDTRGVAKDIHLDAPFVDAFCLSSDAKFALVPYTVGGGFGIYPLEKGEAK